MTEKTGGPAFPLYYPDNAGRPWSSENPVQSGMTLRDYFAAKALQGFCASPVSMDWDKVHELSYKHADAMLKAREE